LDVERCLAALASDAAAVLECLREGPASAPVAACPGWDLGRLVVHLGRTHRWATAALGSAEEPAYPRRPDGEGLTEWFADGAEQLLAALRSADPRRPCWTFGPGPGTVAFWVRRQALETVVHRWDAQQALGRPGPVDDDLAADGIDEVAKVFYPRQVALGRRPPLGCAVTLRAGAAEVVVGEGEPTAEVSGPAELLLLALWRRLPGPELARAGRLGVEGDRAHALRVLTESLVP
jgi:uncharacterized protein (TIGR03083 family)